MEEITADYWKGIVRGVVCMLIATMLFTTQTSVVKWGHMIGYTAAVILIFRGLIQFICCFIEATLSMDKTSSPIKIDCNMFHIIKDIKSIGIIPRRTIIPVFNEVSSLSRSNIQSDYGSFQSTRSYSDLSRPVDRNGGSMINLNINNCESPQIQINITNHPDTKTGTIKVVDKAPTTPSTPTKPKRFKVQKGHLIKKRISRTKSYKCLIWSAIIIRGICGGVGTLLLFQASMLLPVGDMQSLMALTAAITPFLAFLFFRDTLTKLHLLSLIGAIIGVILIVQPPFMFKKNNSMKNSSLEQHNDIVRGYIYAITGSVVQAMIYICIQFARKVPIYMLTMSQSVWGIITGVVVLIYTNNITNNQILWIDNWFDGAYVIVLGCVGYMFLWLVTMSARYITSGVIALLLNLSIVWGYIVQILIFHETPTWITIIGAVCMFLSAAIVSIDKISDAKRKSMSVIQRNITTTVGV